MSEDSSEKWTAKAQDWVRSQFFDESSPECSECGAVMKEDYTYHPNLYQVVPSWTCDGCDRAVVREDEW